MRDAERSPDALGALALLAARRSGRVALDRSCALARSSVVSPRRAAPERSRSERDRHREVPQAARGRAGAAVARRRLPRGGEPGSIADELGELAEGGTDNHLADTATATYDRELDDGLEEGAQQTLAEIDAALQRIDDGTYGICEVCGKPIGAERLAAIPWARLCIDDQRRAG